MDLAVSKLAIAQLMAMKLTIYSLIDILNDFALKQQVKEPTRNTHILDLVLSSQPQLISDVLVIFGMSDHEAVNFQLNLLVERLPHNQYCKVYQYHKEFN